MKGLLAAAVIVVVASSFVRSEAPAAKQKPKYQMTFDVPQQWEYKVARLVKKNGVETQDSIAALLNETAKEGWELQEITGEIFYVFKRRFVKPLPLEAPEDAPPYKPAQPT